MADMTEVKLANEEEIPFEWLSTDYGRAEFTICPVFRRGKLVKCVIYPRQQPKADKFFVWEGQASGLNFQGYQGLDSPNIWRTFWCKEHGCHSIELYVPTDSKILWFNLSIGFLSIGFLKTSNHNG